MASRWWRWNVSTRCGVWVFPRNACDGLLRMAQGHLELLVNPASVTAFVAGIAPAFEINQRRIDADSPPAERVADGLANWGIVVGKTITIPDDWVEEKLEVTHTSELERIAVDDLTKVGLIKREEVLGSFVKKIPFAYPVYDLHYKEHLTPVRDFVNTLENIKTGGRQAKVEEGDVLQIERVRTDGDLSFEPVLIAGDDGSVITDRASLAKMMVKAKVLGETRGKKIDVFHYRNKSGYRKSAGHRQTYTTVEITEIPTTEKAAAKKPAAKKPAS